jgi:hypothetical protein
MVMGISNSFPFDWTLRQKIAANVNLFILNGCPVPQAGSIVRDFLVHSALRLTCNHVAHAPLWMEQVGDEWREPTTKHTWPVLEGDDARLAMRGAADAVVADAYGLGREQYVHVLSSFSHKSYPRASELCLAAFDELKQIGMEAFVKKHDPYWDVPLNENLPETTALRLHLLGSRFWIDCDTEMTYLGLRRMCIRGAHASVRLRAQALHKGIHNPPRKYQSAP